MYRSLFTNSLLDWHNNLDIALHQNHRRQRMTRVDSMLTAGRIAVLGLCCTLLLQGCSLFEKVDAPDTPMVCGEKGGVSVPIWQEVADKHPQLKKMDYPGLEAPAGCWTRAVSNPQSASGWVELDPTTGQPTGSLAPANATCLTTTSKCKFPNAQCTKTGAGGGNCKHAIFKGNYANPQACTCICN